MAEMIQYGLKELVETGLAHVPPKYIHPSHPHPHRHSHSLALPLIDLSPLSSPGPARSLAISQIGQACRDWGFFQIINHGIPLPVVEGVMAAAERFFDLPAKERHRYYGDDPRNRREAGVNWKETIYFSDESTAAPPFCLEAATEYKREAKQLAYTLYGAIVESLGVVPDMEKAKEHNAKCNLLMHYYPPCPDPTLTFGLSEHTDAGFITILLQDQVGGLEVMKDGEWVYCKPIPNAITINVADQMEILTNGIYKSVLHRVVTNTEKPRISIPCFMAPSMDGRTGPLAELIDDNNPALYKEVVFGDYVKNYMAVRFADTATSGTDFAKIHPMPAS